MATAQAKAAVKAAGSTEKDTGEIFSVSGPVVVAAKMAGAKMYELVRVGHSNLVGEIIRLEGATATIQVYEDTAGLQAGDPVVRTRLPLSVQLGPGILESIFDGIQRPLESIYHKTNKNIYIPRGIQVPPLDQSKEWHFSPSLKVGDIISGGDIFGNIESELVPIYALAPPGAMGRVKWIADAGNYNITQPVVKVEFQDREIDLKLYHDWPIRRPRPCAEKLPGKVPLLTGQRVLDTLFPVIQGGTCAIPGAFGCGKTVISQSLSKFSNSDVIVYVGCFEPSTPVRMADGSFRAISQISVGDHVLGRDSKPRLVASTLSGTQPMYEVTLNSTQESFVCNAGHELVLQTPRYLHISHGANKSQVVYSTLGSHNGVKMAIQKTKTFYHKTTGSVEKSIELAQAFSIAQPTGIINWKIKAQHFHLVDKNLRKTTTQMVAPLDLNAPTLKNALSRSLRKVELETTDLDLAMPIEEITSPSEVQLNSIAWLLGYWMGDCHSSSCKFTCNRAEPQVMQKIKEVAELFECHSTDHIQPGESRQNAVSVTICSNRQIGNGIRKNNNTGNPIWYTLKHLQMTKDKAGPADIDQWPLNHRLQVAAGIIDSVGHTQSKGTTIKTTLPSLRDCYKSLFSSLGLRVFVYNNAAKVGSDGVKHAENWEIFVSNTEALRVLTQLCVVPKKRLSCNTRGTEVTVPEEFTLTEENYYFSIKKLEESGNYCGITLEAESDHIFVLANQIVVHNCGERGNEMAEVLEEFPELDVNVDGKKWNIMKRTTLIANTSNMPVAAREASIYTGITLAEYFRDLGHNVTMLADSTSRWAEALREISGRLGEMPGDRGYPAYLAARLAFFYERAGRVRCLGSPSREGSISIVGAVSPPGGDFSDPVTSATLAIVQTFWGLSKNLASRKHFPSVDWNISYTKSLKAVDADIVKVDPSFPKNRTVISKLLQDHKELADVVQLIGRDGLSEVDKLILDIANLIIKNFLAQNAFTLPGRNCHFFKTMWMVRLIVTFYQKARPLIENSSGDNKITWETLKTSLGDILSQLIKMKFWLSTEGADAINSKGIALLEKMTLAFQQVQDEI